MDFEYDIPEERVRELVETLQAENDIVRVVDPATREVLYWPAVESGALSIPCRECNEVWGRHDRCTNCSSREALKLKQRMFKVEINGDRAFWIQSRPMNMDGRPCVLETVNDVTEGLLVEGADHGKAVNPFEDLGSLIITDALTSLYNRRFLDNFSNRLAELERAGRSVNVAMIDLDDMKDVNDTYGHPAGDAVLKDVAGFLRLYYSVRDAHRECYAVRYGGDEFLVIDVGSDSAKFVNDVREHYAHMRRVCYFEDIDFPFSLSMGFASSEEFGWDWLALLEAADKRMYDEKRSH